jgi:hypothetical protein
VSYAALVGLPLLAISIRSDGRISGWIKEN